MVQSAMRKKKIKDIRQQNKEEEEEEEEKKENMRLLQLIVLLLVAYLALVVFRLEESIIQGYEEGNAETGVKQKNHTTTSKMKQKNHATTSKVHTQKDQPKQDNKSLKVAIYMTAHMDQRQVHFLQECWPAANEHLPLVQMADLMVYTSSADYDVDFFRRLGFENHIEIHHYKELFGQKYAADIYLQNNDTLTQEYDLQRQDGAVRAMVEPFLPTAAVTTEETTTTSTSSTATNQHSSWFDGYDWVIRLNPDVLIRRDTWLLQQLHNTSVDGIFIDWRYHYRSGRFKGNRVFTDFFAFRPTAANGTALVELYRHQKEPQREEEQELDQAEPTIPQEQQQPQGYQLPRVHAETHIWSGFGHLVDQGRVAWLPNVKLYSGAARVTGPDCDVVHQHNFLKHCPHYFNTSDTKWGHYR